MNKWHNDVRCEVCNKNIAAPVSSTLPLLPLCKEHVDARQKHPELSYYQWLHELRQANVTRLIRLLIP